MPRARWEALAKIRAAKGLRTSRIDDAPELYPDLRLAWDGWSELAMSRQCRPSGHPMGVHHTEILAWLDLNDVRGSTQRGDLYRAIKILDIAWLAQSAEKREEASSDGDT